MIRLLIVEDSPVMQELLAHIFCSDPELTVVGIAGDSRQAMTMLVELKPDVVTMDVNLPGINGLELTRQIMETSPVPIVIVTGSSSARELTESFPLLEIGALTVIAKPPGLSNPDFGIIAGEMIQTVKTMAGVPVIRRCRRPTSAPVVTQPPPLESAVLRQVRLVAIGASTGGPGALKTILSALTPDFLLPVVIVQHMSEKFMDGFLEWLQMVSPLPVSLAVHGEHLLPGRVVVAPDGCHLAITPDGVILLSVGLPENGQCPSVSVLFRSVAVSYGRNAIGILLSGMGSDGAEGLRLMRDAGAFTIAQDRQSSVVYGMPKAAVELDAACCQLSPEGVAALLAGVAAIGS